LKACFVKANDMINWPWKSLRYPGPKQLLDSLVFSSLGLSLMVRFESDVWVIHRRDAAVSASKPLPGIIKKHHNIISPSEIPWEEYDIVVSADPIIDKKIIKLHPQILWCYHEMQHACPRALESIRAEQPQGDYDLYLDHFLRGKKEITKLPMIASHPYMRNMDLLKKLVRPSNRPAVFVEPRNVPRTEEDRKGMRTKAQGLCGLPVKYAPMPERKALLPKFQEILGAGKKILGTTEYLALVGSCKYYLSWRRRKILGQALGEAAALGLIVVAPTKRSIVGPELCHPKCQIPPEPEAGLRMIQKIESDRALQKEILRHQEGVLRRKYWEEPLARLYKAVKMKRGSSP